MHILMFLPRTSSLENPSRSLAALFQNLMMPFWSITTVASSRQSSRPNIAMSLGETVDTPPAVDVDTDSTAVSRVDSAVINRMVAVKRVSSLVLLSLMER